MPFGKYFPGNRMLIILELGSGTTWEPTVPALSLSVPKDNYHGFYFLRALRLFLFPSFSLSFLFFFFFFFSTIHNKNSFCEKVIRKNSAPKVAVVEGFNCDQHQSCLIVKRLRFITIGRNKRLLWDVPPWKERHFIHTVVNSLYFIPTVN